jgi:hypothetical protein
MSMATINEEYNFTLNKKRAECHERDVTSFPSDYFMFVGKDLKENKKDSRKKWKSGKKAMQ